MNQLKNILIKRGWGIFFLILLVGSFLRFFGLFHGVHFHPDERGNVMHIMNLSWGDMNPHFFAYGSFPLYLLFFLKELFKLAGSSLASYDGLFLIGRVFSAIMGIATILMVFLLGKRVYNLRVAIFGAFFLSFSVLHIQYCHFFAVDILLTFLVILIMFFLLGIVKHGRVRNYASVGFIFGIALATKISILPMILPVLLAHFIHIHNNKLLWKLKAHLPLIALFLILVMIFAICQPFTFLDFQKFSHDVQEQSNMVSGRSQPPYTIQYEKTKIFIYPIVQLMKWSMGYPLVLAAFAGLFLSLLSVWRRWTNLEILLLAWFIPYFLITGSFKVKFLRYLLPLFPFFALFAGRFFDTLLRYRRHHPIRNIGIVLSLITAFYLILYTFAFMMIYRQPHPWITASRWIYSNVSSNETILLEHWDHGLPIPLKGFRRKPRTITLPLYEHDCSSKTAFLAQSLAKGNYIVCASKRLYGSIGRVPKRYPDTVRYYQLLMNGKLGYQLIKTFQTYPSLFAYKIVDDFADESFSVYDHPKVYIFKKITPISAAELKKILKKTLLPSEKISFQDIIRARTFRDQSWHPFEEDTSIRSVLLFFLTIELLGLIFFPLAMLLAHDRINIAYPLSKLLGVIIPAYLAWFFSATNLLEMNRNTIIIAVLVSLFLAYILIERISEPFKLFKQSSKSILRWEIIFGIAFAVFILIRVYNPEIYWGEKPMDFSFLNTFYRAVHFPPSDPWFSGKPVNYYYFSYFQAAFLGRLLSIPAGIIYNLYIALLPALTLIICIALLNFFLRNILFSSIAGSIVILGSNISYFFQILFLNKQISFGTWWDTSRILPSPAIDEYPIWSFLFADLHAHVSALPIALTVILFIFLFLDSLEGKKRYDKFLTAISLSFFISILTVTNSWDFIPYSALLLMGIVYTTIRIGKFSSLKKSCRTLLLFFNNLLFGVVIIASSFLWTLFYHLNFKLSGFQIGFVHESFASINDLLLHFGQFIIPMTIILLLILSRFLTQHLYFLNKRVEKNDFSKLKSKFLPLREVGILFFLLLFYGLFRILPREAFSFGLFIVIVSSIFIFLPRVSTSIRYSLYLIAMSGFIIAGSELIFVIDRMNTIFKFYYPAWIFLGTGTMMLIYELFFKESRILLREKSNLQNRLTSLPTFGDYLFKKNDTEANRENLSSISDMKNSDIVPSSFDENFTFHLEKDKKGGGIFRLFIGNSIVITTILFLLALAVIFGSIAGIVTIEMQKRVPGLRPTLDGRKYMNLYDSEDYVVTNWINKHISNRPVLAEAQGPSYQQFNRISMHTGLPAVVGWEHHIFQRGASRNEIAMRKQDLRTLYTTTHSERFQEIVNKYNIKLIYFGKLEKKTYLKDKKCQFYRFSDLIRPIYFWGDTVLYQVINSNSDSEFNSAAIAKLPFNSLANNSQPDKINRISMEDWEKGIFFTLSNKLSNNNKLYGIAKLSSGMVVVSDVGSNHLFTISPSGFLKGTININLTKNLKYPTSLLSNSFYDVTKKQDFSYLWVADTGNNRVLGIPQKLIAEGRIIGKKDVIIIKNSCSLPSGISSDNKGNLYIASFGNNKIIKYNYIKKHLRMLLKVNNPLGLTFVPPNILAIYNASKEKIIVYNLNTKSVLTEINVGKHKGFVINEGYLTSLQNNRFYFAKSNSPNIKIFDTKGNLVRSLIYQLNEPHCITASEDGCLLVVDTGLNNIISFCPIEANTMFEGGKGAEPGYFNEPRTITQDAEGNFFVADTRNNRIQKFSSDGKYLMQWGKKGEENGEFKEPMGITVSDNGDIYVADTWNQRIQVFDGSGKYIRQWEDGFYGPRDILIHKNRIYVADTGNSIVKIYDLFGHRQKTFGKNPQLNPPLHEPIGLAFYKENLIVADSGNKRIVFFNQFGKIINTIPIPFWIQSNHREPYITVLPNGFIAATDPIGNRVLIINEKGKIANIISRISKKSFVKPRGVFFSKKDSYLYVVDTFNHRIQKISLFSIMNMEKFNPPVWNGYKNHKKK